MKKDELKNYITNSKDQWMTPDLIEKLKTNPSLLKGFQDPEILQAVGLMQVDPKAAKERYSSNKKVTEFFVEFSKLMGTHYEQLSQKEEKQKESGKKEQVKAKPSIEEVHPDPEFAKKLNDPQVKVPPRHRRPRRPGPRA